MNTVVMTLMLSLVLSGAGATACDTKQSNGTQDVKQSGNKSAPVTPTPERGTVVEDAGVGDLKVLAEGSQSGVTDAFLAVARDAETYAALREVLGQLPEINADTFRTNVAVAAFLGRRNTGGYSVALTRAADGTIRLAESSPPKGAMVTQSLTTPFKVVTFPVNSNQPLSFEMEGEWKTMMRPYRVTMGEFTVTGGFAGSSESFRVEGNLRIMRHGKLATVAFDLKSAGGTKARTLQDVATGTVRPDGSLTITHLAAGSFVSPPPGGLRANGKFTGGENGIALAFESLPSNVSDGYEGRGKLEATAAAPPPQRRRPLDGDDPM